MHMQYQFQGSELKSNEIFAQKSMFPLSKSVTFNNKLGGLQLCLQYDDKAPIAPGLPRSIAKYEVRQGELEKEGMPEHKFKLLVNVKNDLHQVPQVHDCHLCEEWLEEAQVPLKSKHKDEP